MRRWRRAPWIAPCPSGSTAPGASFKSRSSTSSWPVCCCFLRTAGSPGIRGSWWSRRGSGPSWRGPSRTTTGARPRRTSWTRRSAAGSAMKRWRGRPSGRGWTETTARSARVLADHLRARIAQGVPNRQPTAADLDAWLAAHRSDYETPRRYDYQVIAFARRRRWRTPAKIQQALASGVDARTLGRPLVGGNLTAPELAERLGAAVAARVERLPVGKWERVDTEQGAAAGPRRGRLRWAAGRRRAAAATVCRLAVRAAPARRRRSAERRRPPLPVRGAAMTRGAARGSPLSSPCALAVGAGQARAHTISTPARCRWTRVQRASSPFAGAPARGRCRTTWRRRSCFRPAAGWRARASPAARRGWSARSAFPWLPGSMTRVMVDVQWRDGTRLLRVASPGAPEVRVYGGAVSRWRALRAVAADYTQLGVEHILTGFDHLLFVVALVLLVRGARQLLATITAFTLAHSVSLAATVLGLVRVPPPPVEACIALSIVLVCAECLRPGRVADAAGAVGDRLRVWPLARPGLRVGAAGFGTARAARPGRAALLQPGCRAGPAGGRRRRHRLARGDRPPRPRTAAGCARR